MQAVTPEIAYGILCVFWAIANAKAIKGDTWILHGANGLLHLSTCVYFGLALSPIVGLVMLFEARILFDVALNLSRGLSISYVPENPKSIIDAKEIALFEWLFRTLRKIRWIGKVSYPFVVGILPKLFYLFVLCVLLFIQLKHSL